MFDFVKNWAVVTALKNKKINQKQAIMLLLDIAGEKGVRSFYFYKIHIPRFSARIDELKKEGYDIRRKKDPNSRGIIYYLHEKV